ncbi:hypothetical protein IV102_28170 [bacterium]|nr:hypothetical protein [bacterium]
MSSQRYRIFLVPDGGGALVPRRGAARNRARSRLEEPLPDRVASLGSLLNALQQVSRRGPGPSAWAPVMSDPLTFLLDSMSDALLVRGLNGQLLFANTLAQELRLAERHFTPYEEFERAGERYLGRGLQIQLPEGQLTFTLVSRVRR